MNEDRRHVVAIYERRQSRAEGSGTSRAPRFTIRFPSGDGGYVSRKLCPSETYRLLDELTDAIDTHEAAEIDRLKRDGLGSRC